MNKKRNIIIGLIVCVLLMTVVFFVFNHGKSNEQVVTEYFELLKKKDYKQMYQMLDQKTVYTPTQKYFIEKHKEIYDVINPSNIQVKVIDEKDNMVQYQISMDTVAGKVKYKNKIEIKNEQIKFNKQLIFDEFSDKNKVKVITTQPYRGYILDRNGKYLAKQGNAYSFGLVRGKLNGENDYAQIAKYLETDVETIQKKMSASWIKDDSFVPIKNVSEQVKNQLIQQEILNIKGVKINTISMRVYPYDKITSHIIGYVQNVNSEDLKKHKNEGYTSNSIIGRSGIKATYEKELRGEVGGKIVIVDENNNVIKTVAQKEAKDGKDIRLTIDIDLQQSLYNEYQNDKSASVALNPQTGEVLALVSTPSYSNNDFVLGLSTDKWNALNNDSNQPLMSRYKQTYTPGSTMKPITAAIGLETKTIDANKDLGAKDKWQKDSSWGNYYVTTLHAPSPNNLKNAITYSDNVYFARSALSIGKDNLFKYYKTDSGYGQGQILMNPLQLASIYSSFVNEGSIYQPHIVQGKTKTWIKNVFSKETSQTIKEDLINVIADEKGTGHSIYHDNVTLAGKTGTAEIKQSQSDTTGTELGWFTVMTTDSKQPLLITTLVEDVKDRGGSGYVVEHTKTPLDLYLSK